MNSCGMNWREAAREVFPKIGVGFLRQRPEGGAYDMWRHYEAQPFPVEH